MMVRMVVCAAATKMACGLGFAAALDRQDLDVVNLDARVRETFVLRAPLGLALDGENQLRIFVFRRVRAGDQVPILRGLGQLVVLGNDVFPLDPVKGDLQNARQSELLPRALGNTPVNRDRILGVRVKSVQLLRDRDVFQPAASQFPAEKKRLDIWD